MISNQFFSTSGMYSILITQRPQNNLIDIPTKLTVNPQYLLTLLLLMIDGIIRIVKLDRLIGNCPNVFHLSSDTKTSNNTTLTFCTKFIIFKVFQMNHRMVFLMKPAGSLCDSSWETCSKYYSNCLYLDDRYWKTRDNL